MSIWRMLSAKALHLASYRLSSRAGKKFYRASQRVKTTQLTILEGLLKNIEGTQSANRLGLIQDSDLASFQQQVPISDYEDWQALIERQQNGQESVLSNFSCERYQPTSGSTSKIKWIPYNQPFLDELDHAIGPWVSDLYARFPSIRQGRHYWSLSWVPSDLRNKITSSINDDLQLLPWWKRLFMTGSMAVPESISLAKTSEESSFATACYLVACHDLSFISVWSPTFALSLLQLIKDKKVLIEEVLSTGDWPSSYAGLNYLTAPENRQTSLILNKWDGEVNAAFTQQVWPKLGLISAWDTSSSAIWADKLRALFAHSQFQGKGLWATEGVISIPYQGQYPLAITSHFYEFEDLDTQKIHTSWQLKTGQNVRPIISTANGLLRYAMKDQLKVTGFINECPCLEFIGRLTGVDMVGEKLSPEIAVSIINEFSKHELVSPISLLAIPSTTDTALPRYVLLCNDDGLNENTKAKQRVALSRQLEDNLSQNFHYKLARELGQLKCAQILLMPDAMDIYVSHKISKGMVAGNIKIEPMVLWMNQALPVTEFIDRKLKQSQNTQKNKAVTV
ncbi:MAG: hypothetical protein ACI84K_000008 [Pseudohongiellaceae bacterium]|jgi:hypothetical protein